MKNYANLLIFLTLITFFSCNQQEKKATNIIIMIPDGFGFSHLTFAKQYAKHAKNSIIKDRLLNLEKMVAIGEMATMTTSPYGNLVTDSAASATQIATGHHSLPEQIGVDQNGNSVETILEFFKKNGKATGLVTNTRITHATPAAFAAHVINRNLENTIAEKMLETGTDIMLGGGLVRWVPKNVNEIKSDARYEHIFSKIPDHIKLKSKRKDTKNLLVDAIQKGYDIAFTKEQLQKSNSDKILGLFYNSSMPYTIDVLKNKNNPSQKIPTLLEMAKKSIEILSKNPNGFFLMIEGGLIDYAGHQNDAGTLLHEILDFDQVVGYVLSFAKKRKDTLVIIIPDHETGSPGFSYSINDIPAPKFILEDGKPVSMTPIYNYGQYDVLDKIYNQKKSFGKILTPFAKLSKKEQTPENLVSLINSELEFKINIQDAKKMMADELNPYFVKHHPTQKVKRVPLIHDFKEFQVAGKRNVMNILARVLAKQQQLTWGTGAHTSCLVPVISYGPGKEKFKGIFHSTEIKKFIIEVTNF